VLDDGAIETRFTLLFSREEQIGVVRNRLDVAVCTNHVEPVRLAHDDHVGFQRVIGIAAGHDAWPAHARACLCRALAQELPSAQLSDMESSDCWR
jgi:hypothetical protein